LTIFKIYNVAFANYVFQIGGKRFWCMRFNSWIIKSKIKTPIIFPHSTELSDLHPIFTRRVFSRIKYWLSYFDIAIFREADFLTDDMTEPAVCYRLFTLLRVRAISSQPELISHISIIDTASRFFSNRRPAALHEYSNAIWETDSSPCDVLISIGFLQFLRVSVRKRATSHEVIPAENRRILRGKIIFRRLPFTSSGRFRTVKVHIMLRERERERERGRRKRDRGKGSIQSARRVHRSITTAIACLCSSPAISHLAGEPDPALLVPTDNWTNHSHSLRANYSPCLPSASSFLPPLPLSLSLSLSRV